MCVSVFDEIPETNINKVNQCVIGVLHKKVHTSGC